MKQINTALFVLASFACATAPSKQNSDQPKTYGAAVSQGSVLSLDQVLATPDTYAGKTIIVDGIVRKNCTKKGCWMEVASSESPEVQGCRVTFKDYGFFVPLDSAGAKVRVEGVVTIATVSKDDVDHLEGEGAHFSKKLPDGSAREIKMVATGVEMSRSVN